MQVRRGRHEDIDGTDKLLFELYLHTEQGQYGGYYTNDVREFVESLIQQRTLIVAVHDNQLVGCLGYIEINPYFDKSSTISIITFFWVTPSARGSNAFDLMCKEAKFEGLVVNGVDFSNTKTREYLEKHGYQVSEIYYMREYHGMD